MVKFLVCLFFIAHTIPSLGEAGGGGNKQTQSVAIASDAESASTMTFQVTK